MTPSSGQNQAKYICWKIILGNINTRETLFQGLQDGDNIFPFLKKLHKMLYYDMIFLYPTVGTFPKLCYNYVTTLQWTMKILCQITYLFPGKMNTIETLF